MISVPCINILAVKHSNRATSLNGRLNFTAKPPSIDHHLDNVYLSKAWEWDSS